MCILRTTTSSNEVIPEAAVAEKGEVGNQAADCTSTVLGRDNENWWLECFSVSVFL
jgi:hypothetical protein